MKNIVITGSTRGIGLCMAKEFMRAGCHVTISGRHTALSEAAERELADFSGQYIYISCNVRRASEVKNLWDASAAKWGKIDHWINNAGQNCPHAYAYETPPEYVDGVIDTNIKGMVYGSQTAARNMLTQGRGQIWNMEGLGSDGMIQVKTILYGATKRSLSYFTRGLAKELSGTPVTAGRLSPGMMLTDFITKTPEGESSPVLTDDRFRRLFNTLADRPETVAAYFVPRMLANKKNDAHIVWLTNVKAAWRFMTAPFHRRELI